MMLTFSFAETTEIPSRQASASTPASRTGQTPVTAWTLPQRSRPDMRIIPVKFSRSAPVRRLYRAISDRDTLQEKNIDHLQNRAIPLPFRLCDTAATKAKRHARTCTRFRTNKKTAHEARFSYTGQRRRSSTFVHRHDVAARFADIKLARTTDTLFRIGNHFLPLCDPADGSGQREDTGKQR